MHGVARAHHGVARRLHEKEQALFFFFSTGHAHFRQVIKVIGTSTQNFAGVQQRRQQPHLLGQQAVGRLAVRQQARQVGCMLRPVIEQTNHAAGQVGQAGVLGQG